jgi:hypothetical protein
MTKTITLDDRAVANIEAFKIAQARLSAALSAVLEADITVDTAQSFEAARAELRDADNDLMLKGALLATYIVARCC